MLTFKLSFFYAGSVIAYGETLSILFAMAFAVVPRGRFKILAENAAEVVAGGKAQRIGDVRDALIALQ